MAQISMFNIALQQNGRSVLSNVVIRPDLEQHWLDVLGQFAGNMRLQNGMKHVVSIDNEKGFITSSGELIVSVDMNSEGALQMVFPSGTWEWKSVNTAKRLHP
jgi:hypothetical protein